MSLGMTVRNLRLAQGLTQEQLAGKSGLGISYLSRLENNKVAPTSRTLARLSAALGVTSVTLLGANPAGDCHDSCPISLDARCILDHPAKRHGGQPCHQSQAESYSSDQLQILRAVNYLLHRGSPETRSALAYLVHCLLAAADVEGDPATLPEQIQISASRGKTG